METAVEKLFCLPHLTNITLMLEAPGAALIARQLNDTIRGKKIILVEAMHTPHKFAFFNGAPSSYEDEVKGKM